MKRPAGATPSRDSLWRMAALAAFVLLPLVLIGVAASNFVDGFAAHGEAKRRQATLSTLVAQLSRHRADRLSPEELAKLYLASTTDSLAAAELQTRATDLVRQAGGRLNEVQANDPIGPKTNNMVSLMLSFDIDNAGLLDLVYAVETALPLMEVTDLNVRRVDREDAPNNGMGMGMGAPPAQLKVDLTVAARWRPKSG